MREYIERAEGATHLGLKRIFVIGNLWSFRMWASNSVIPKKINNLGYSVMIILGPKLGDLNKRNSSVPFAPFHFITSKIPWISKKICSVSHKVFIPNIVSSLMYLKVYERVDFVNILWLQKYKDRSPYFNLTLLCQVLWMAFQQVSNCLIGAEDTFLNVSVQMQS